MTDPLRDVMRSLRHGAVIEDRTDSLVLVFPVVGTELPVERYQLEYLQALTLVEEVEKNQWALRD
jgi:hypothetical protein